MRRRTSVSGDFSERKRRTAARSSSCSSLKAKFMPGLPLGSSLLLPPAAPPAVRSVFTRLSTRPGPRATRSAPGVSYAGSHGTAGENLERRGRRGAPDRRRPDGQQRLHPAVPPQRRGHAHRRGQRARGAAGDLQGPRGEPGRRDARPLGPHPGRARRARRRHLGGRDQRRRGDAPELRPDPRRRRDAQRRRPAHQDPGHARATPPAPSASPSRAPTSSSPATRSSRAAPATRSSRAATSPPSSTSIENRIFARFDADTRVLPGHGTATTVGNESPHLAEWVDRGW